MSHTTIIIREKSLSLVCPRCGHSIFTVPFEQRVNILYCLMCELETSFQISIEDTDRGQVADLLGDQELVLR